VNDIGQRGGVATAGSAFGNANRGWTWGYDALGQVTSAVNAADTGLNRSYAYDAIGNRTSATDGTGGTAVTTGYTPNNLNQYATIDPGDPVSPVHDADGNLTEDMAVNQDSEDRQYVWDAENRLVAINKVDSRDENGEVTGTTLLASYGYDPLGRRIRTITTTDANQGETDIAYLYDGWNVAVEYVIGMIEDPEDPEEEIPWPVVHTFNVWGLDLSGSLQGAGGVGGLLATGIFHGSIQGFYFPTYDGNGNISEYLDDAGDEAVHFEYDPFGRLADVPNEQIAGIAEVLTYRFSTKPIAFESGLYYYGYRYYDPVTGRWPSRDPIGEMGGINLYGFVGNNGVNRIDDLGLADCSKCNEGLEQAQQVYADEIKKLGDKGCKVRFACKCCDDKDQAGEFGADRGMFGPKKTGEIIVCCRDDNNNADITVTVYHELIHALQNCKKRYRGKCKDSICREIQAYANSDCINIADHELRKYCVKNGARASSEEVCKGEPEGAFEKLFEEQYDSCSKGPEF
jgi:RHS repeat-associated protein